MITRYRRFWPWGIVVVGILLAGLLIVTRPRQPAPEVKQRIWQVAAMEAEPGSLRPVLALYGQVETSALMKAAAPGSSRVVEVAVREGEQVAPGQRLLRLDPGDFVPKVAQVEAEVAELEAQINQENLRYATDLEALEHERTLMNLLQASVKRFERLRLKNLASAAAVDQAKIELERQALAVTSREMAVKEHSARLEQLKARLRKARANLELARLALERSQVVAPFAGIVAKVEVGEGDYVQANQLLLSLYPSAELEIRARIPTPFQLEIQRALAEAGTLTARVDSAGLRYQARLSRLAGSAKAGGIDALFEVLEKPPELRLAMPATLYLRRPAVSHAIAVPYSALYGSDRIYKIVEGRLQAVEVKAVGDFPGRDGRSLLLVTSDQIGRGDKILVTHLPNAATGLPVAIESLTSQSSGEDR